MISTTTMAALPMQDAHQTGDARRVALRAAETARFDSDHAARVGIIATEAATNLVKHAKQGELIVNVLRQTDNAAVEILAVDRGPGMFNVNRCLEDGFSTAGSPGTGLGAAKRMADAFDLYSLPNVGSVLLARVWRTTPKDSGDAVGSIVVPLAGETACGDACAFHQSETQSSFLMVDGLGHGPHAADAAKEALRIYQQAPLRAPQLAMEAFHGALAKTRGAALAIALVDLPARSLRVCSVGNIVTTLVRGITAKMVPSANGIVGHVMRRTEEVALPWSQDALLLMHSDGLRTQPRFDAYPGLFVRPPALIAGLLYGQLKRGRDDASVLVATAQPSRA